MTTTQGDNMLDNFTRRHLETWTIANVRDDEISSWYDYVISLCAETPSLIDLGWSYHYRAFITMVDA